MRKLVVALFSWLAAFLTIPSAFAADYVPLDAAGTAEAVAKIDASCAGIKSLKAEFRQVKDISILNEKMVSTGKMYFSDGMLRWEYLSPYTYLFILNKEKVLLQSSRSSNKMDVDSNRLFKTIARIIMDSITGQGLSGSSDFKVRMFLSGGCYVAELEPKKKEMSQMFRMVRLRFGKDLKVNEVNLVESGGETVISILDAEYNKAVDAKLFVVD